MLLLQQWAYILISPSFLQNIACYLCLLLKNTMEIISIYRDISHFYSCILCHCMDIFSTEELMLLHCGVGEDSWESLGLQGDTTSHLKGNQSWIFIGRTDVEAETPILWQPDAKNWLVWKDSDAGKDWRWEEKGMTEDEMVGWHHRLSGHEFEWILGVGDGQGGLVYCSPWGHRVRHNWATELNRTELNCIDIQWLILPICSAYMHVDCS